MKILKICLIVTQAIILYACSDNSSGTSDSMNVNSCDYDSVSGYSFCKNEAGEFSYAIDPQGNIVSLDSLPSSGTSSDSLTNSCTVETPAFSLNGIPYYRSPEGLSYYFDTACNIIYLTPEQAPGATSSEEDLVSSSSSVSETSSSSVIPQDTSASVVITPNGNDPVLAFSNKSLTISNNNNCVVDSVNLIKILCGGNYYLTGTGADYEILVQADTSDKVYFYLNNLNLTSETDAAFYIQSADKVFFMLVDGTVNTLNDAATRTKTWTYNKNGETKNDTANATIYAKEDITFKGNGSLVVNGNYHNGIHTSKDLRIKNVPSIHVTAVNHALKGKNSVDIEGGLFTLETTQGDGIQSDDTTTTIDAEKVKGIVSIKGGEFTIHAGDDGIQAYNAVMFNDSVSTPILQINSTGKGIVATNSLYINAGHLDITSTDDAIHSNLNIFINGGETVLSSGDDGVHADSTLRIANGSVYVKSAVEGFEAWYIIAMGGVTTVLSSDDAWNAAGGSADQNSSSGSQWGGNMGGGMMSNSVGYITISGGYHYLYSTGSDVDVLDANGTVTQTGGVLILELGSGNSGGAQNPGGMGGMNGSTGSCSTNMSGGLIDTDSGYEITGGVMLGFGNQTEEYPACTATSYTSSNAYGSSNAAFKPSTSGSMILYGGSVTSVSTVDVSNMQQVNFANGLMYYYK